MIVDGHNLIPKIPGLSLTDVDDENQLIQMLQEYCRLRRVEVECFFDKAPQGHPRIQRHGQVVAKFARPGKTADDEIKEQLKRLEKRARDWTVVSSDNSILVAARAARARILTSEDFSREIQAAFHQSTLKGTSSEESLSVEEMEMWLRAFGADQTDER